MNPPPIAWLAPLFMVLEVAQLIAAERLLGVKAITANLDPRDKRPGETVARLWSLSLLAYYGWMVTMLLPGFARAQVGALIAITLFGYSIRRNARLKWILGFLTLEGALRIGMLLSIIGLLWRNR